MLLHIGRDVAGAAVIVPAGAPPEDERSVAEALTVDGVIGLIEQLPDRPRGIDASGGIRLSLAGQQDKLVLVKSSAGWAQPLFGFPSTTILKPEPAKFPGLATNELFGLTLAAEVGLQSANARIEHFGPHTLLAVDRFDREHLDSSRVVRIHQEDVLTAAGYDPLHKYEYDDEYGRRGPTLRTIADLIITHLGIAQLGRLLDIVVFNLALGNADAHARNLSLLLAPDGSVAIAPLYDLVCTLLYPNTSTALSQRIADQSDLQAVSFENVVEEATGWGLRQDAAIGRTRGILNSINASLDTTLSMTRDAGGSEEILDHLRTIVLKRVAILS